MMTSKDWELQLRRFLRLANGLVAGCCALLLHLSRTGVIVLAAQAGTVPVYNENPLDRIERHLEYNDHRLDEQGKDVSQLKGGAEIAFSGILILNVLGFIHIPRRKPANTGDEPR
jgi:hypothetical protein